MDMFKNREYLDTDDISEYLRLYLKVTRGRKFERLAAKCLKFYMNEFRNTSHNFPYIDGFISNSDLSVLGKITESDLSQYSNAVFTMKTANTKSQLIRHLQNNINKVLGKIPGIIDNSSFVWCMVINHALTPAEEKKIINYALNNGIEQPIILKIDNLLDNFIKNRSEAIDLAYALQIKLPDKNYKYYELNVALAASEIMLKLNEIWNEKFEMSAYYDKNVLNNFTEINDFFKMRYIFSLNYLDKEKKESEQKIIESDTSKVSLKIVKLDKETTHNEEEIEKLMIYEQKIIENEALKLSLKISELDTVYEYFMVDENSIIFEESDQIPNKINNIGNLTLSKSYTLIFKDLSALLEFYVFFKGEFYSLRRMNKKDNFKKITFLELFNKFIEQKLEEKTLNTVKFIEGNKLDKNHLKLVLSI